MNAYVAYCAAIAGRMHDEHVQQEERRLAAAERRAHARPGYGRRASDLLAGVGVPAFVTAADVVEGGPMFRVLSGRHAGQFVGADDVTDCDACDRLGFHPTSVHGDTIECQQCGGVGYVLGYPNAYEAIRVERVEGPSPEGPSTRGG